MRVLVLTAFYPIPGGTHERMFVHVRNQYYQRNGINVTVLNFDAKNNYDIDGIRVITLNEFVRNNGKEKYDILISHSANLRNHYRFLKKYQSKFERLVFFFHGHEMLYLNKDYPRPYSYLKAAKWHKVLIQDMYDALKIKIWATYYKKLSSKSEFIFVSEWIHRQVLKNTNLNDYDLKDRVHIINNSIGSIFELHNYDIKTYKEFDYITIRSNIDGSKYCIDLLTEYAKNNPEKRFLLIGKGKYFDYHTIPGNITWINKTITHDDMLDYINRSKCALMLTREDTQGVMTCEMETYGIPVITSDIEVCHEFFENMSGVKMIPNSPISNSINDIYEELYSRLPFEKDKRFFAQNTIEREIQLFQSIIERN